VVQVGRQVLAQAGAWLTFVEIPLKSMGTLRVVDDTRARLAAGKWWQACPIKVPEFRSQSTEGSLSQLTITLPNVSRTAAAFLEAGELQGRTLSMWLQMEEWVDRSGGTEDFVEALAERHTILSAQMDEKSVTLTCGHPASQGRVPRRVFDKTVAPIFSSRSTGGVA
jgi:hypothetical protein